MGNKIFVLGGDGFCGWPTSLHLSNKGYDVKIVDNLARRKIDVELETDSLTPIRPINERVETWKELTGNDIEFINLDVSRDYHEFLDLVRFEKPDAIVHFAEQRAAPYSMKSDKHKNYTVNNNISVTHNVLNAIVESGLEIHLVHLGTAGNNGYVSTPMKIPEGYINTKIQTDEGEKEMEFPWPLHHPSIYHLTKSMDFLMFQFYAKNDNVRITDLRQGIVWGTQTDETKMDERLINRFDWEGDYGTVLNKFLMQAAVGHPLTVHGKGGQTRAFIHIKDTAKCIKMAVENPPEKGERERVFNQNAECLNIKELAEKVEKLTGAEIRYYKNPRKEAESNDLKVATNNFFSLGWQPVLLEDNLLEEAKEIAEKYKHRVGDKKWKTICTSTWRKDIEPDLEGSPESGE